MKNRCDSCTSGCISIRAHEDLVQIRDHLRLLAQLTDSQGKDDFDVVYLSAQALANCFDRMADDVDRIIKTFASPKS